MRLHYFTIILKDLPEMTEAAASALFEAGCDDCTPGSRDGVSQVDFDREAASLEDAIRSAVRDIRRAGFEPARVEIDRDDLVELVESQSAAETPSR